MDQRVAGGESFAVVQPAHLVHLHEPGRERNPPREEPLEVLVDRHLAGKHRERVGIARRKHTRALQ
jgi:hypothetical protein